MGKQWGLMFSDHPEEQLWATTEVEANNSTAPPGFGPPQLLEGKAAQGDHRRSRKAVGEEYSEI